jgi:Zn-dependent protease
VADSDSLSLLAPSACPECGTALASNLLTCPGCGRLVHSEELKRLASEAAQAAQPADALRAWRRALALLPAGSRQKAVVLQKIEALVPIAEAAPFPMPAGAAPKPGAPKSLWQRILAALGVSAAFIAKFKFAALFILTKAKLLLLGFTKMGTLLSMAVSLGFYWSLWGWRFALGFVLSIYVHEMGHVAMLTRLGVRATAPMFIPGFGAIVRLRENLPTAREDARVGLAGPIWGLGAAIAAYALSLAFESPLMRAIATVGAWINLFNLTPVWQLDGSRAFRALTRKQRWIAVAVVGGALFVSSVGILWAVLLFAVVRAWEKNAAEKPDHVALGEYVFLIAALSLLAALRGTGI